MLNRAKQKFLNMASFVVLIVFQIWAISNRNTEVLLLAALAALIICAMIIAIACRWDEPAYLDWSITGYITFISAFLLFWPERAKSFLYDYSAVAIYGSFFAAAFFPPILGLAPFTIHYAKKKTPKEFWDNPLFIKLNRIITYIWVGIFAICMMLSITPSIIFQVIMPNILMLGGSFFSSRFPTYYLRRQGITFRPSSIEEFMAFMSLGFNPGGAKGVNAVIQFDFSGDVEGSCHLKIANCKIELQHDSSDNPALTIAAPFDTWMDILTGHADARQMFMEKKFQVSGDMSLLMKMGELFKKRN